MTAVLDERSTPSAARTRSGRRRAIGLAVSVAALIVVTLASLAIGTKDISLGTTLHAVFQGGESDDALVIRTLRVPRTLLGLAVGAALGLAGALMQALTRNPLADPGLLGVDAGAAAAVVTAISVLGASTPGEYVWFALVGAGLASVAVYVLGSRGRAAATPVRLTLAGAAVSAALLAYVTGLTITQPRTFDNFRFWTVGALSGRPRDILLDVGPFLLAGAAVALLLARSLNALALGDDAGRALGAHVGRTRVLGMLAVTLLAGAATAAAGPIGFVGLAVPHLARAITGPDQRWVLPYSMILAPVLLLAADVVGRVLTRPAELEVGLVTAFLGAPVLIVLARRRRLANL